MTLVARRARLRTRVLRIGLLAAVGRKQMVAIAIGREALAAKLALDCGAVVRAQVLVEVGGRLEGLTAPLADVVSRMAVAVDAMLAQLRGRGELFAAIRAGETFSPPWLTQR